MTFIADIVIRGPDRRTLLATGTLSTSDQQLEPSASAQVKL